MLQNRFPVTGRYFASRLRRRGRAMNQVSFTNVICNASQIDESTFLTQHTVMGCQCAPIEVDPQEVGSALTQGKVPRLQVRPSRLCRDHLDLQMIDAGPYVAISHVWAHGLGNFQSNSLPPCQLRALHGYVENLSRVTEKLHGHSTHDRSTMAIWIDTLGVPLLQETRKLALKLLPRAYAESNYCLVIDEELRQLSSKSTLEEFCQQFVISTWARRLWTLQESIVTWNKLYLQLKEGPSSFEATLGQNGNHLCPSLR